MNATVARNVAIIVVLALIVWLVPGGGTTAGIIEGLLSAAFMAVIGVFAFRFYRQYRSDIFGLDDQYRALLYGAVALILVTLAASSLLWETGPTTVVWLALLTGAIFALVRVWRHWRSYA